MWPPLPTALLAQVESLTVAWPGRLGLACEHLRSRERWCHNDVAMPAASLIKVAIAVAAYQAHEARTLDLRERVGVSGLPADDEVEFDNLGLAPAQTTFSWRKVIDRMLTESDNAATNALVMRLGFAALDSLSERLGWERTRLQRLMLDSAARAAGRENWTTPTEMAALWVALARGELLSPLHTQELLGVLAQQRSDDKLAAGLSLDRHFAHKTGELPGWRHDAGLVDGVGGWVVVAMLGGPCERAADADALLERLAAVLEAYWLKQAGREALLTRYLDERREQLIPDGRLAYDNLRIDWRGDNLTLSGVTTVPDRLMVPELDVQCLAVVPTGVRAVVQVPCLPLRAGPGHGHEMVSQAQLGEQVRVIGGDDDWALLSCNDGYVAWGKRNNLLFDSPWHATHRIIVPVMPCQTMGGLPVQLGAMSRVHLTADGDVVLPNGERVRVPASALAPVTEIGTVEGVLAFAALMRGLPYVWGGTSGWAIDCSGLVQLAFATQGVALPRDADQQEAFTNRVSDWSSMLPGDLLYFPGHVAIYTGEGRYIHASAKAGCVTTNSLRNADIDYEPKLAASLHGVGRVIWHTSSPGVPQVSVNR